MNITVHKTINMSGCRLRERGLFPGSGGDCLFHSFHKSSSTANPFHLSIQYLQT